MYSNCILCQDVEAFQKFLKNNGGHYGGWKEKDHLYFVKARSKYPLNKIAEIVNENFPGMLTNFTWIYTNLRLCVRIADFRTLILQTIEQYLTLMPKLEY